MAGKDPMALGRGRLLLLVVVAGTGSPTPDLTAELLYQLWVLLLHLLSKLLARLDETGQVILRGLVPGVPRGCGRPKSCQT